MQPICRKSDYPLTTKNWHLLTFHFPPTASLKTRCHGDAEADFAGAEHAWQGAITRTEGELDPNTRMLNVIAQVENPYEQMGDRPPLAVGLFVDAEIHGAMFDNIVVLPRVALRSENQVYIVDSAGKLRFREVDVLRIVEEEVFIQAGLAPGELVCISPLDTAIDGMPVRIPDTTDVAKR